MPWAADQTNGPDFYPYADRPVREPVLQTLGQPDAPEVAAAVITRTAYGSEVLNTAGLMFIDIDLPKRKAEGGLLALIKGLFGRTGPTPSATSPADAKLDSLRQWQTGNSSWTFRVYHTHSGLRYLVSSSWQDPVSDLTHALFRSLGCDTRYQQLCKVQKSFRARLTPKPWRCGCDNPSVRFPYADASHASQMDRWIASYQQASEQYATCQFLATVGTMPAPPEIAPLIAEHDTRTKATSGLPLA